MDFPSFLYPSLHSSDEQWNKQRERQVGSLGGAYLTSMSLPTGDTEPTKSIVFKHDYKRRVFALSKLVKSSQPTRVVRGGPVTSVQDMINYYLANNTEAFVPAALLESLLTEDAAEKSSVSSPSDPLNPHPNQGNALAVLQNFSQCGSYLFYPSGPAWNVLNMLSIDDNQSTISPTPLNLRSNILQINSIAPEYDVLCMMGQAPVILSARTVGGVFLIAGSSDNSLNVAQGISYTPSSKFNSTLSGMQAIYLDLSFSKIGTIHHVSHFNSIVPGQLAIRGSTGLLIWDPEDSRVSREIQIRNNPHNFRSLCEFGGHPRTVYLNTSSHSISLFDLRSPVRNQNAGVGTFGPPLFQVPNRETISGFQTHSAQRFHTSVCTDSRTLVFDGRYSKIPLMDFAHGAFEGTAEHCVGVEVLEFPKSSSTICVSYSSSNAYLNEYEWGNRSNEIHFPPYSTVQTCELPGLTKHSFYRHPSLNLDELLPYIPFPEQMYKTPVNLAGLALLRHELLKQDHHEHFTSFQLSSDGCIFQQTFMIGPSTGMMSSNLRNGANFSPEENVKETERTFHDLAYCEELKSHRIIDFDPLLRYLQDKPENLRLSIIDAVAIPGLHSALKSFLPRDAFAINSTAYEMAKEAHPANIQYQADNTSSVFNMFLPKFMDVESEVDQALDEICAEHESLGVLVIPSAFLSASLGFDESLFGNEVDSELIAKIQDELVMARSLVFPSLRKNQSFGNEMGQTGSILSLTAPYIKEPVTLSLAASRLNDYWLNPETSASVLGIESLEPPAPRAPEDARRDRTLRRIQSSSKRKSAPAIIIAASQPAFSMNRPESLTSRKSGGISSQPVLGGSSSQRMSWGPRLISSQGLSSRALRPTSTKGKSYRKSGF